MRVSYNFAADLGSGSYPLSLGIEEKLTLITFRRSFRLFLSSFSISLCSDCSNSEVAFDILRLGFPTNQFSRFSFLLNKYCTNKYVIQAREEEVGS